MNPSLIRKPLASTTALAQRDGPVMFEQDQRGGRVVWDVRQDVPGLLLGEHGGSFGCRLGASLRTRRHSVLALEAEPDQGADPAAEFDRLVLLSRNRSSSSMIRPWRSGCRNPSTINLTGPIAMSVWVSFIPSIPRVGRRG
jgi:hypothetical protein